MRLIKTSTIIIFIYSLLVAFGYIYIEQSLNHDSKEFITRIEDRINKSLKFDNGKWDTSLYNSDPLTPYPNASTTFPIYIITEDGYVLERSKPISGILDTSDFKHLAQFQQPTTLSTVINENWRVLAKTLTADNQELGIIMVAYYNPDTSIITQIDNQLLRNITIIEEQLKYDSSGIDLSNLDERKVDYNLSFEIVTKSNKVLLNNGRTPSFIDPSYVEDERAYTNEFRNVNDNNTNESFLLKSISIKDMTDNDIGIIVVGRSVEFIKLILQNYLILSIIVGAILIPVSVIALNIVINSELKIRMKIESNKKFFPRKNLSFNSKTSKLIVDSEETAIVYGSNQYYLLKTIFKNPFKRIENDELLEELGEESTENNSKKMYDSSIAINKKLGFRLINYTDKTFMLNPELEPLLKKKK